MLNAEAHGRDLAGIEDAHHKTGTAGARRGLLRCG
jgi:hypothetical protein